MKPWYFKQGSTIIGPLSQAELVEKARSGSFDSRALVRVGESGKWLEAGSVRGLVVVTVPLPGKIDPGPSRANDRKPPGRIGGIATGFAALSVLLLAAGIVLVLKTRGQSRQISVPFDPQGAGANLVGPGRILVGFTHEIDGTWHSISNTVSLESVK